MKLEFKAGFGPIETLDISLYIRIKNEKRVIKSWFLMSHVEQVVIFCNITLRYTLYI